MEIFIWGLIAFLSGSIPWSLLLGLLFSRSDVRSVGDKNPGGANVLKMAGWKIGLTAIFSTLAPPGFLSPTLLTSLLENNKPSNRDQGMLPDRNAISPQINISIKTSNRPHIKVLKLKVQVTNLGNE
jgi:hypothetical protein